MKKAPIILLVTLICVMIYTETKALNALIVGINRAIVSGYNSNGPVTIRIMENGADLGVVSPPYYIETTGSGYTAVGGLKTGKSYKFQVIINGVTSSWSNSVTSY